MIAVIIVLNCMILIWVLILENSNSLSKSNANFKEGCLGNALAHGSLKYKAKQPKHVSGTWFCLLRQVWPRNGFLCVEATSANLASILLSLPLECWSYRKVLLL